MRSVQMKKAFPHLIIWVLIGLLLLSRSAFASHEVMPWRDNHAAAVSVTLDDGLPSQVTYAVPLLNTRNLKGTFFPLANAYQNVTWDQWSQIAEQGHEIGSQSVSKPDLTTLSEADLRWELSESQRVINQNVPSQSCVSFAYPYGECNDLVQAVTSEYYIAGRASWASEGGEFNYYEDGPSWEAVNFYDVGSQSVPEKQPSISDIDFNLNFAIQTHAWHCMHFHEILDANFFAAVLDDLLSKDIWIDTVGSIVRYMRERMSFTLTVLSEGSTEIQLDLTHSLDRSIYNQPLTIRSTVPPNWSRVNVQQGDVSITVDSTIEGLETAVYYNAVPNNGTITLTLSEGGPTLTSISWHRHRPM